MKNLLTKKCLLFSIQNVTKGKQQFFNETEKTEVKQSSRFTENINVFKEKMRGFVHTFIEADKRLIKKYHSQFKLNQENDNLN